MWYPDIDTPLVMPLDDFHQNPMWAIISNLYYCFHRLVYVFSIMGSRFRLPSVWRNPIDETYLCGQKWPNLRDSEYTSRISLKFWCSGDAKKQVNSPFWCVSRLFRKNRRLGKPFSPVRYVIWIARGNSIIVGRRVSAKGTFTKNTAKWFFGLPPEYSFTVTDVENPVNKIRFRNILMMVIM